MIKLNIKATLMLIAAGLVTVLLLLLGAKSKKIKELAAKLLRSKADLDKQKLELEVKNLKAKEKKASAKRKEKVAAYRDYIKSTKSKPKS